MAQAEQIFRDLLQQIAVDQKFTDFNLQVTPISTFGANYTSYLFLATISEEDRELNVFAKVAAIGNKFRAQFPMQLYDIERFFYMKLAKVFRQLEEKNNISGDHKLKIPVFYGSNDKPYEETIVLENLTSKGYISYDRFKTVNWPYAVSAVTELAKYHALSIAYQHDEPENFEKILDEMKFKFNDKDNKMKSFFDNVVKQAIEATREENKEKMKKFFGTKLCKVEIFMDYYIPKKISVIGHGDFRPSNLMHKILEDGSVEVIAVDYQTLRTGSPVVDLLYFIFTGTDEQFRAQYYEKLIDHYYSELTAALTRLGVDSAEMYTREDFQSELKEKLPFGLAVAVFTLPVVTVDAENAPKVDGDLEMADFSITKTGKLYPLRLNGVVDDFVRWGVL